MIRGLLCLAACVALGCHADPLPVDAGSSGDAGAAPSGTIELESERTVALVFGEETELSVRYTENGVPVPGTDVRFALEGRAHDATLSALSMTTDEHGRAWTRLRASSSVTAFRARVSAPRAAPVYVDVSVGNMGFGDLRVVPTYEGTREGRRVIDVYAGIGCDDEPPTSADRMAVLDGSSRTEARFGALPAGIVYAVAVRMVGPTGATLAEACGDGIEIEREYETRVELALRDTPLAPDGHYTLTLAVDATASAELVDAEIAAQIARIEAAAVYLDGLEAELLSRGEDAAAEQLEADRRTGGPDAALTAALDLAEIDLGAALLALGGSLQERLGTLGLSGPLSIGAEAEELRGGWEPQSLELGLGIPDAAPLSLPPGALALGSSMTLEPRGPSTLGLMLSVAIPLGTLVGQTLDAIATAEGSESPAALLEPDAGCDVLATWVLAGPLASSCDGECALASCRRALDDLVTGLYEGMAEWDETRAAIALSGEVTLRDEDGDAVVDRLSANELAGRWGGPGDESGDPVTATLVADRTVD